jgi:aryl-alcohol dehydrogenase
MAGKCGLVGIQNGDLVLDGLALVGKTVFGILEGGVHPQEFIPRMIALWQEGRFPFDRLVQTFPLSAINDAEQSSLSGKVIKPVLIPGG